MVAYKCYSERKFSWFQILYTKCTYQITCIFVNYQQVQGFGEEECE